MRNQNKKKKKQNGRYVQQQRLLKPPPPRRKNLPFVEILIFVFTFLLVCVGMTFLFFEKEIKALFPDLNQNDDNIDTNFPPTDTSSGEDDTTKPVIKNKKQIDDEKAASNAIFYIAVVFGSLFLFAIGSLVFVNIQYTKQTNEKNKGFMGVLHLAIFKDLISSYTELVYSIIPVVGLTVIAAVAHKLKWSTAKNYLLGFAFAIFIAFVMRESLIKTHQERRHILTIAVPASILVLIGMYFSYMGENEFATTFYLSAVGIFFLSIGYLRSMKWREDVYNSWSEYFQSWMDVLNPKKKARSLGTAIYETAGSTKESLKNYIGGSRIGLAVQDGITWYYSTPLPVTPEEKEAKEAGLYTKIVGYFSNQGESTEEVEKDAERAFDKTKTIIEAEEENPGIIKQINEYLFSTKEEDSGGTVTWTQWFWGGEEQKTNNQESSS